MKTFFIECEHNIYLDNYNEGETENVNNYDTKGMYKTEDNIQAIEKHLHSLGYSFNKDYIQADEEDKKQNKIWYSVLCNSESEEANEKELENFKNGSINLYANNMTIYIYELTPSKI